MPSNLNSYVKINETVSAQSREVNPFLNDMPIELISYEDSNNLLTSLNITTGLGNTDKRRTLAKALGFSSGVMLALGASGSRRSTNPIYKKVALTGSWTFAANNTSINGTGGDLLTGDELRVNEVVFTSSGLSSQVQSVNSDNQFILYVPFEVSGTSVTLYKMIPVSDYLSQIELTTLGYLQSRFSKSSAILTYYTIAYVNGYVVLVPQNNITVTGAAGWRYIVVSSLADISLETIPPAEITADTFQYSPSPVFNVTHNSYMSTVNTTKRIIGCLYFDGTNILTTIAYKSGTDKNDDYWFGTGGTNAVSALNSRLQFTAAFTYSRGDSVAIVDNGAGYTDSSGVRVTSNKAQKINISGNLALVLGTNTITGISVHKNGALYLPNIVYANNSNISGYSVTIGFNFTDVDSQDNDYYTFVVTDTGTVQVTLINLIASVI